MSLLYLIRHAQAGPRDDYDSLSSLGVEQARLLGGSLAARGLVPAAAISGSLRRQRHTAEIVLGEIRNMNSEVPSLQIDPDWDEFGLGELYRRFSKLLCAEDPDFADDFAEMKRQLADDPHATGGATGRCDAAVVRAWMENRFPDGAGLSWESFRRRVRSAFDRIDRLGREDRVLIFTSAGPIGAGVGFALDLTPARVLSILAVVYNTGLVTLRRRKTGLLLQSFNEVSHLPEPGLVTLR